MHSTSQLPSSRTSIIMMLASVYAMILVLAASAVSPVLSNPITYAVIPLHLAMMADSFLVFVTSLRKQLLPGRTITGLTTSDRYDGPPRSPHCQFEARCLCD